MFIRNAFGQPVWEGEIEPADIRIRCPHCDEPLTEDDDEDFGCCKACHEANQPAAEKGIREGADERGYEEAA